MSPYDAPPPGWIGGFAQSNPAFAYPDPDLTSLPMLCNMDNIDLLRRQQQIQWPEFSWITRPSADKPEDTRCFQMFAPDISSIGYNDYGRIYSIICPQQGACWQGYCLNVEVSVTGQRGWVGEPAREMAADMTVEGKIWFSRETMTRTLSLQAAQSLLAARGLNFPSDKAHAIKVQTHLPGNPQQPIFDLRRGLTPRFDAPDFTRHPEAFSQAHIDVEIGPIVPTGSTVTDDLNALILQVFNAATGNMLHRGGVLSWNLWCHAPQLVDEAAWRDHAEKWRKSIDANHGSPDGPGTIKRYADGSPFNAAESELENLWDELVRFIERHI